MSNVKIFPATFLTSEKSASISTLVIFIFKKQSNYTERPKELFSCMEINISTCCSPLAL